MTTFVKLLSERGRKPLPQVRPRICFATSASIATVRTKPGTSTCGHPSHLIAPEANQ